MHKVGAKENYDFVPQTKWTDVYQISNRYPSFLCHMQTKVQQKPTLVNVSPPTIANASGITCLLPSYADVMSKVPLYFPYKKVPSI